ncbi:hypothetical protein Hanom_Chr00s000005g01611011 [Helianthus anomalus]
MSFYTVIQMCNQTALYWFSTYWFRASYPFRPLNSSYILLVQHLTIQKMPNSPLVI